MKFAAAFLVGAMLAFDMGGPSIKPPGSSASHCWKNTFMTGRHRRRCRADAARRGGSCDVLAPKLFTRQEKEAASSAIVVVP